MRCSRPLSELPDSLDLSPAQALLVFGIMLSVTSSDELKK